MKVIKTTDGHKCLVDDDVHWLLQEQRQRMAKRIEGKKWVEEGGDGSLYQTRAEGFNSGLQAALNIVLGKRKKTMNPILKAHLEGVEMFEDHFDGLYENGILASERVISFLTTYAINILKAAKQNNKDVYSGISFNKSYDEYGTNYGNGCEYGAAVMLDETNSAIDEGIEGIKKGDV